MESQFTRREWLLWALVGALSWSIFHPRGSTMAVDSLQFACGAALCITLQCIVLCRAVGEFRAHLFWLGSALLWLVGAATFWFLPWQQWGERLSEVILLSLMTGLWLGAGLLQRTALKPIRGGTRLWSLIPLLAATLATLLTLQLNAALLRAAWPATNWASFFASLGALFGLVYGTTTGAVAYALLARPQLEHPARERA